jgi:hypothetical protein
VGKNVKTGNGRLGIGFGKMAPETVPGFMILSEADGTVRMFIVGADASRTTCDLEVPSVLATQLGTMLQQMAVHAREGRQRHVTCEVPVLASAPEVRRDLTIDRPAVESTGEVVVRPAPPEGEPH